VLSGKHSSYLISKRFVFSFFPKKIELQALIKFYDVDGDGNVSYEEFLRGLRDEMSPRRVKMVQKIFARLDRDGSGRIDINDVLGIYDVALNPDFIEQRKTKE